MHSVAYSCLSVYLTTGGQTWKKPGLPNGNADNPSDKLPDQLKQTFSWHLQRLAGACFSKDAHAVGCTKWPTQSSADRFVGGTDGSASGAAVRLICRSVTSIPEALSESIPLAGDRSGAGSPHDPAEDVPTLSSAEFVAAPVGGQALPTTIGRYRIIRVLGEGGMGTVFEAEQDQPRRHVALKVIRASWASPQLLLRFKQESQALGWLHHPGIAQIYEAGSAEAPSGLQPFFAMELIQGLPLTQYARKHHLDLRRRLALMIQVCDAVEHAHQRGIIHRDLKPGNILVDETGQPKILDFGLARVTDSDAEVTRQTDVGQMLGTLAYMSPEQVLADPKAMDTRSDVYALGVILYELLADKLPYVLSRQLHEAMRTIQETDPNPLSSMNRVYRGDIDTIVAKALEKDKTGATSRRRTWRQTSGDIWTTYQSRPRQPAPAIS
jgi:hypothetical protein